MRRRLVRLMGVMVVLPLAAQAAESLANRLESSRGPSTKSRALRQASRVAQRRSRGRLLRR